MNRQQQSAGDAISGLFKFTQENVVESLTAIVVSVV